MMRLIANANDYSHLEKEEKEETKKKKKKKEKSQVLYCLDAL